MMRTAAAGLLYFALVFGAGFALGPVRVLWVVPQLGTRAAELLEAPIMLAVIVVAARWVTRKLAVPPAPSSRIGMGVLALVLLLIAEFKLVLPLRGMTFDDYFAARDPVSGTVYYLLLGALAVMPLALRRGPR
jgi:hypothetical protein